MIISKETLEELYFKQHKTQYEIAEILGITQSRVSAIFVKYGFDFRGKWTKEEIEYLEENFGLKTVKAIARKLNRSEDAVIIKAKRIGLGGITETTNSINATQLANAIGTDSKTVIRWINKKGLKAKKLVMAKERIYWRITLINFWDWAKENQDCIKWSRFEVNSLGKEPSWVEAARKKDLEKPKKQHLKWTKEQDKMLKMYWNTEKKIKEIAEIMNRSVDAVSRRAARIGLSRRNIELPWTDIEDEMLIDMKLKGMRDVDIAEEIGRSYPSIAWRRRKLIKEGKLNWAWRNKKATKNPDQSIHSSKTENILKNSTSLYHEMEECQC